MPDYYLYTAYKDRIGHSPYARDTLGYISTERAAVDTTLSKDDNSDRVLARDRFDTNQTFSLIGIAYNKRKHYICNDYKSHQALGHVISRTY